MFAIVALGLFVVSDVKANSFVAVAEEKENLDHGFNNAIDDAAIHLVETEGMKDLTVNKDRAVKDFFSSMFSSLGILDVPDKQETIKNYVPVITVTCEDGYYLYYGDEYKKSDGYTYLSKRWSEKFPFYFEDEDFIYRFTLTDNLTIYDKNGLLDTTKEQIIFYLDYHDLKTNEAYANFQNNRPNSFLLKEESFYLTRKGCIIKSIEDSMTYYCNQYNEIASQYGITYNFAMPATDDSEWTRSIDDPCMIVLFQGYPYGSGVDNTYNRFVIAGARIKKSEVYYLEQKGWYFVYHKDGCMELEKEDGILFLDEPYYTIEDCVKKGAYACPYCVENGVHAPNYTP